MPDSQVPPLWGPAYDERDLDALLSGETGSNPAALRPVESTLAALRAPATRREFSDEAAARAAFRAFAPPPPTTAPLPRTAAAEHTAVPAHTLVLPPADGRPQRAARARHRHRRPAGRGARRPGIAVTGAAAAALIVVATVVTGALTGSIAELTSFGRHPVSASASARATGQSPGSQGLLATGAARARTPDPQASASAPPTPRPTSGPGSLCREYFGYFYHPEPGSRGAWIALYGQLSKLAEGPAKIYGYCLRYLDNPFAGRGPLLPGGAPADSFGANARVNPTTGSTSAGSQANAGAGGQPSAGPGSQTNVGDGSQANQPSGTSDRSQIAGLGAGADRP